MSSSRSRKVSGTQGHGAGEVHVVVGDAPGDGGQGQQARGQAFGGALAVGVGDQVVLAQAQVRAVLLGGADGDEDILWRA